MTPQAPPEPPGHRPRPRARRWLVFAALALLLGAWAALDLLPRLASGLLGQHWSEPGGSGGEDWDQVQVVWDPTDPRKAAPAGAEPSPPAPDAQVTPEPVEDSPPDQTPMPTDTARPGEPSTGGQPAAPGSGPALAPAPASRGEGGPEGLGRRSPRILFAAWPSRELLSALDRSGRLRYRLRVEADGRVSEWRLVDDGGFRCAPCRAEAERIIAALRFAPGTLDGKPVACWVPYELSFEKGGR
jgi:hypothetical protein